MPTIGNFNIRLDSADPVILLVTDTTNNTISRFSVKQARDIRAYLDTIIPLMKSEKRKLQLKEIEELEDKLVELKAALTPEETIVVQKNKPV